MIMLQIFSQTEERTSLETNLMIQSFGIFHFAEVDWFTVSLIFITKVTRVEGNTRMMLFINYKLRFFIIIHFFWLHFHWWTLQALRLVLQALILVCRRDSAGAGDQGRLGCRRLERRHLAQGVVLSVSCSNTSSQHLLLRQPLLYLPPVHSVLESSLALVELGLAVAVVTVQH